MLLVFLCTIILFNFNDTNGEEIVTMEIGRTLLRGVIEGRNGQREYYAFKGIQYATAERWKDPVLAEFNETPYNATNFGDSCPQLTTISAEEKVVAGNENCLYLNVFTKVIPDSNRLRGGEILNPVMFYIHGGGFTSGSGIKARPRRFMTAEEKVVFVSINYRLGVLGFLSTGEQDLAGNWGLLDILSALNWVQKYIRYFGGDPHRVTILGHSAGAAAVHMLTLSPRADGKFHRAILISGNAFCGANLELEPLQYLEKISAKCNCPEFPRNDIIDCLRNQSVQNLISSQESLVDFWIYPKRAVPVIDSKGRGSLAILPDHPMALLGAQRSVPVPMVLGVTKNEGLYGYAIIHKYFGLSQFRNTSYFTSQIIPRTLRALLKIPNVSPRLLQLVLDNYFKNVNMSDDIKFHEAIGEMTELIGDVLYYSCAREFLEQYAQQSITTSPVYSYVFSHKMPNSPSNMAENLGFLQKANVTHELFDFGVPHGGDAYYLFDPVSPQTLTTLDESVALAYTRSLIAFAKNGIPAGIPDPIADIWKPISPGDLNYFNITSISAPVGVDFRKREALFWLRTVPLVTEVSDEMTLLDASLQKTETTLELFQILFWIIFVLAIVLLMAVIALGIVLWKKRTTGQVTLG